MPIHAKHRPHRRRLTSGRRDPLPINTTLSAPPPAQKAQAASMRRNIQSRHDLRCRAGSSRLCLHMTRFTKKRVKCQQGMLSSSGCSSSHWSKHYATIHHWTCGRRWCWGHNCDQEFWVHYLNSRASPDNQPQYCRPWCGHWRRPPELPRCIPSSADRLSLSHSISLLERVVAHCQNQTP